MSLPMKNPRAGFMTPRMRERVLKTLELYLEGLTWKKVAAKGGYSLSAFQRLMVEYPDLAQAYQTARKASGHSMEDKALTLAEELTTANEFSGTQVQAHKAAMEQYRWSASRRNPAEYAEAGAKAVSVVVPIQINSSLDLADGKGSASEQPKAIWDVHAEVLEAAVTAEQEPQGEPEADPEVESDLQEAENALVSSPEPLEALADRLGLPEKVQSAVPARISTGRPRKKHKSRSDTVLTAHRYAIKKKSPSVRAALGIKDDENELAVDARDQSSGSDDPE